MWDPATYRRFAAERSRPFTDLLTRVTAESPRAVVDLGCGSGELTATLAARWPHARVSGVDASADMIEQARRLDAAVTFHLGDVRQWQPDDDTDVLVSNAVLQWVPDHARLLTGWVRRLPSGAWLAVQVPGNFAAPSHQVLRAVAARFPTVRSVLRAEPVDDAEGYATLLADAGCAVDAWETTYVHLLPRPSGDDLAHPVVQWMEGTALRPVRAVLDDAAWDDFRAELSDRLVTAYPVRRGMVAFPFRRVFVVARTSGTPASEGRAG